ncbi:MAG: hypothetical protein RQ767_02545 [Thermovirgaceae bacterium]|nr:hypothetical protein [Thermovirgaceae bacterium]
MSEVYIVEWEEYESGWGIWPDGYSVHTSKAAMEAYRESYGWPPVDGNSSMPLSTETLKNDILYAKAKRAGGTLHVQWKTW